YDRGLADHLRLLRHEVEQQKIADGIRLPPSVITLFQGDKTQSIRWEIRDINGESLAGNAHIPIPANWTYEEDRIRFRNQELERQSVRVANMWGGRDRTGLPFLAVVAQSNEMRAT